jgi:hypothetical protein
VIIVKPNSETIQGMENTASLCNLNKEDTEKNTINCRLISILSQCGNMRFYAK